MFSDDIHIVLKRYNQGVKQKDILQHSHKKIKQKKTCCFFRFFFYEDRKRTKLQVNKKCVEHGTAKKKKNKTNVIKTVEKTIEATQWKSIIHNKKRKYIHKNKFEDKGKQNNNSMNVKRNIIPKNIRKGCKK
ncbi:hypothetical protein RFI_31695 [Reticulomyxa filosa]|uniref:Uncharacterized protein n=1 Tax=Reticulomyxa filosa TaxID=46433 RepID=X6LY90_RETFI|nr:hypothetical protein RFI_31695 [Reticulomyxa filosa]|eukprot:ETO05700.1 hypothetical protein RFI_31695 [Reticulomyxa filosa]